MIFSNGLFLLFLCLYKISVISTAENYFSNLPSKTGDETEKVTLKYVIKGTFSEITCSKNSEIHLAHLLLDGMPIDKYRPDLVKSIEMTQSKKEELMRVITGDFLIKEILNPYDPSFTEREFSIQKNLLDERIVRVYYKSGNMIFMEYVKGADLFSKPRSWKGNSKIFAYIFKEIAEGVKFMHQNGIVHGDLKSENILISKKGDVKIADFGGAVEIKRVNAKGAGKTERTDLGEKPYSTKEYTFTSTKGFCAPELIDEKSVEPKEFMEIVIGKKEVTQGWIALKNDGELNFKVKSDSFPTKRSDVFSFAATVVDFFITKDGARYDRNYYAFQDDQEKDQKGLNKYRDIFNLLKKIDRKLAKIIHQALDPSPEKRPNIEKILECLKKLDCCTKDEFKEFAAKFEEPKMIPYKKRSNNDSGNSDIEKKKLKTDCDYSSIKLSF